MLAIRMQRVGRRGHAQYRVVVQDRRFSPKSGRIVAYVGNYNPHAKTATLDSDKIAAYLKNGAQPSGRVAELLKKEGLKLPSWAAKPAKKKRATKNPDKLRRNQPKDAAPKPAEKAAPVPEVDSAETPPQTIEPQAPPAAEETTEASVPSEETPPEPKPAEEAKT
jgi:small subunit ribosomal protein S16